MCARTSPIFAESHKKRRFYRNHYAHYEQSSLWLYEIIKLAKPRARARTGWILLFIACTKCTLSQCCVVTRRDNTDFTDAIKKGCLACARVPLHFLGHESHSMQQQGLELIRLSIGDARFYFSRRLFSTVFSTIFDQ